MVMDGNLDKNTLQIFAMSGFTSILLFLPHE